MKIGTGSVGNTPRTTPKSTITTTTMGAPSSGGQGSGLFSDGKDDLSSVGDKIDTFSGIAD